MLHTARLELRNIALEIKQLYSNIVRSLSMNEGQIMPTENGKMNVHVKKGGRNGSRVNGAIKQGVEEELGLGIVSIHTLERELEGGRLVVLDVESFPILRQWFLVHRAGKRLSALATEFADFVRHEAQHFVRNDIIETALGRSLADLKSLNPDPP